MNTNRRIDELRRLQNSVAGPLPGMATKGTKTQKEQNHLGKFVLWLLCFLWLDSISHQVAPDIEKGGTSRLPAK